MKKLTYLSWGVLAVQVVLMIACQDKPDVYQFPTENYYYEVPYVPVTENYVVGARYESVDTGYWYDYKLSKVIPYTGRSIFGEYSWRKDPQVIVQQLAYGKKAGIDFFIINWNGHGSDTLLWEYERSYQQGDPKLVVHYDPGHRFGIAKDTLLYMPARLDSTYRDVDSLYVNLMSKNLYYKGADGNPVMVFSDNFTNRADIPYASTFVAKMREYVKTKSGGTLWIIGELGGGWTSPEKWGFPPDSKKPYDGRGDTTAIFDALYNNNMTTNSYDRFYGYYSFMDFNFNYWQVRMTSIGREYIPCIEAAYDNYANDPKSSTIILHRCYDTSATKDNVYWNLANVAKRNVGKSRIVIINSWNNYRIGSNLEPTVDAPDKGDVANGGYKGFGELYLEYTRKFFKLE
ncbi:MAG: glycoside hydrolase family 99-like domain-containing protein [Bacteroidales bacterium]|jgi:hypothetical protein|nr:glycoside hydrolase family 99-like domain-containing protein [Bacteroidales bacterium]